MKLDQQLPRPCRLDATDRMPAVRLCRTLSFTFYNFFSLSLCLPPKNSCWPASPVPQVHKRRYAGPMVRWKSRRVGDAEMVSELQPPQNGQLQLRLGLARKHVSPVCT